MQNYAPLSLPLPNDATPKYAEFVPEKRWNTLVLAF
jgi:hypothetical protein